MERSDPEPPGPSLESTEELLTRARSGDAAAREALVTRCLPALQRLAHGRLPHRARGMTDTDDIVQTVLIRTVGRLDHFVSHAQGSLLCYLRRTVLNQIRDEARRVARTPQHTEMDEGVVDPGMDPLEEAIGKQSLEFYERALEQLEPELQEAVVLRLEMGCSYQEIAEALGRPTANAARLATARAVARLSELMKPLRDSE
jgi:RNA polymerase sigma-70 factor (ECF subfamily)